MKDFNWNTEKNKILINERNISFEEIVIAIFEDKIVDVYEHSNQEKYPSQKIYEIELNDYIYLVPFIENEDNIFLKTIIPSRKATKQYFNRGEKNE
ncbi:MAG: BrnT family toxin [Spirochaetes bacterium]|nr:BrnT family toxin [Spirochaetota bacterium]